ncbi:MAG: hypothetical protein K9J06_02155 [Flavobacteriales bacterium]|nr:hypothetical protein [Flavobacteriales bacterium]
MLDIEFQREWRELIDRLEKRFGEGMELETVLFLIGVQELGQGHRQFKKHEKLDLMHIAICRLLSRYGYYEFEGVDAEGWPHYRVLAKLPKLNPKEQSQLMKEAVIEYFKDADLLN